MKSPWECSPTGRRPGRFYHVSAPVAPGIIRHLELHGLSAPPVYEDAAAGNFTLVVGSPLLDRGEELPGINDRFSVNGPDLGAFERGGLQPGPADGGVPWPDAGTVPWPAAGDARVTPPTGDKGGCGCGQDGVGGAPVWALGLVFLVWVRRRSGRRA